MVGIVYFQIVLQGFDALDDMERRERAVNNIKEQLSKEAARILCLASQKHKKVTFSPYLVRETIDNCTMSVVIGITMPYEMEV